MFFVTHQNGTKFSITSSAAGESFSSYLVSIVGPQKVNITSDTKTFTHPGNFLEGEYRIFVYGVEDDSKTLVDQGRMTVTPNPDDMDESSDFRTYNEKILDAIRSVLEGRSGRVEAAYSIDGKALTLMTMKELQVAEQIYYRRVCSERGEVKFPQQIIFRL